MALAMAFFTSPVRAEDAPPCLLKAIARQESGKNPLAVNVAGEDFAPASREEAMKIIRHPLFNLGGLCCGAKNAFNLIDEKRDETL